MSEDGESQSELQVVYNVDRLLDCHTHLTGMEGESAESILECMDFCGVEKVFLFAPMLDIQAHEITSDSLDDIRTHNDYCADICTKAPERLLGFCTLNLTPHLTDGDLEAAVDLMIEEAERCYHELGLRGAGELIPTHWQASEPPLARLWQALADLGMYTVFHAGIFYDGRNSTYCRPAYFEGVRAAPGFKGHVAHVGWPWYDECIAMMKVTTGLFGRAGTRQSPTARGPRQSGASSRSCAKMSNDLLAAEVGASGACFSKSPSTLALWLPTSTAGGIESAGCQPISSW